VPTLTSEEKVVGRAFRSAAQAALLAANDRDPTEFHPPNFVAIFRHQCPSKGGKSLAMQLKEVYVFSADPIPAADQQGFTDEARGATYDPTDWPGGTDRFGFIYREGVCKGCSQRARSRAGRLVDAWDRPPLDGKMARSRTQVAS
jgi:hypothetical protein